MNLIDAKLLLPHKIWLHKATASQNFQSAFLNSVHKFNLKVNLVHIKQSQKQKNKSAAGVV